MPEASSQRADKARQCVEGKPSVHHWSGPLRVRCVIATPSPDDLRLCFAGRCVVAPHLGSRRHTPRNTTTITITITITTTTTTTTITTTTTTTTIPLSLAAGVHSSKASHLNAQKSPHRAGFRTTESSYSKRARSSWLCRIMEANVPGFKSLCIGTMTVTQLAPARFCKTR